MSSLQINQESLGALHWHAVAEKLHGFAATDLGRIELQREIFSTDVEWIRHSLESVEELRMLLQRELAPNLSGCVDFGNQLMRVSEGRMLSGEEFVALGNSLRSIAHLRSNLLANESAETPHVAELAENMVDTLPTARWILNTFEPSGRIRDDATPRLSELRRDHVRVLQRTKRAMEDYIHSYELQEMLQDSYYTVREERFVLPVKAQYRPRVAGIIHGSSSTGATVFIEPEAMVEANNDLLLLHEEMEREIERILFERTERILGELDSLTGVASIIGQVDSWMAKAKFADKYDCEAPQVSLLGNTDLRHARNPLLELKENAVVANDILLNDTKQFLIITGPNTGGKTVTLLTLGLMTLMVSAGIPIPVSKGSSVAIYPRVYTLFGDPQDIHSDRSTFSGQLARVSQVLDTAGPGSLVLMDEPIVGTEPAGGAALAIAVLEFLADRGARGAVTTHYDRLKTLSVEDERFENASVGLHPDTLHPNFQLTRGVAGSSSPISIAAQLGLRASVIDRARKLAGENPEALKNAIEKLDEQRLKMVDAEVQLRTQQQDLEKVRARLVERGAEEARNTQKEVLGRLEEANQMVRAAVRAIQEGADARKLQRIQKRLKNTGEQVKVALPSSSERQDSPRSKSPGKPLDFHDIKEGQSVYLAAHGKIAIVTQTPDTPSRIAVAIGPLKLRVPLTELTDIPAERKEAQKTQANRKQPSRVASAAPPKTVDVEVDLRGSRVEEALEILTQRLDKATLEGRDALFVIHGHGSGALKTALRKRLSRSPYVERWEPAGPEHGGDGTTVVFLR